MEISHSENNHDDSEAPAFPRSAQPAPELQQIETLARLIDDYERLKVSLRDVAPRWSLQMQEQLQAAGLDVSAGAEQIGLLRQFYRVFRILQDVPGGCTMGEISEHLGVPFSNATRVIEQMVQRKLLERHSGADDRRVIRVQATPSGEQVYWIFNAAYRKQLGHLLGQFTPEEREHLLHLGQRLFDVSSSAAEVHTRRH